jgi:SAM-dependent methyltransferase
MVWALVEHAWAKRLMDCNIDLPPASFDAVIASYSFIHIPRTEHYPLFCNIARWLRPTGCYLPILPNCEFGYEDNWLVAPMFWV